MDGSACESASMTCVPITSFSAGCEVRNLSAHVSYRHPRSVRLGRRTSRKSVKKSTRVTSSAVALADQAPSQFTLLGACYWRCYKTTPFRDRHSHRPRVDISPACMKGVRLEQLVVATDTTRRPRNSRTAAVFSTIALSDRSSPRSSRVKLILKCVARPRMGRRQFASRNR